MAFDFTLSRLKLQTKIADITNSAITTAVDSVTNTISAAETVINHRREQTAEKSLLSKRNTTHIKCVTLGASGSGKSELLCVFSNADNMNSENARVQHAKPSCGETRCELKFGLGSISFTDGLGTVEAKSARLGQIERYINDLSKNFRGDKQIDVLCFFMVDLSSGFSNPQTINLIKAELRIFKRKIIDRSYEGRRGNFTIAPRFIFVGTHLDKKTNDEDKALSGIIAKIMEQEGMAANYQYRIIVADIYSENGRKDFIEPFLCVKEEFGFM